MDDERIRELFGFVPYFADQVIQAYEPLPPPADDFIVSSYWCGVASVNLGDVAGVMLPQYAGQTWRQFLAR